MDDNEQTEFSNLEHIPIERYEIHPRYDLATEAYDFWMIKLKWNADAARFPHVKLEDPTDTISDEHDLITMGFGTTKDGFPSNVLQEVTVKYINNTMCATKYLPVQKRIFDPMLCAADVKKDSCMVSRFDPAISLSLSCSNPFFLSSATSSLSFSSMSNDFLLCTFFHLSRVTEADLSFTWTGTLSSVLFLGAKDAPTLIILVYMPVLLKATTLSQE